METPVPSWLDNVDANITLEVKEAPEDSRTRSVRTVDKEAAIATYEMLFEDILDYYTGGGMLIDFVKEYNDTHSTPIFCPHLRTWLNHRDRKPQVDAAREIGCEAVMEEAIHIVDDEDNPMHDMEHIKMRYKAREKFMSVYNRKLFGSDPSLTTGSSNGVVTINIKQVESPYLQQSPAVIADNKLTIDV